MQSEKEKILCMSLETPGGLTNSVAKAYKKIYEDDS
jgi:hypothetical protein